MDTQSAASSTSKLLTAAIAMLLLAVFLAVVWVLAVVVKFTFGALIHLFLFAAAVLFILAAVFFVIWLVKNSAK